MSCNSRSVNLRGGSLVTYLPAKRASSSPSSTCVMHMKVGCQDLDRYRPVWGPRRVAMEGLKMASVWQKWKETTTPHSHFSVEEVEETKSEMEKERELMKKNRKNNTTRGLALHFEIWLFCSEPENQFHSFCSKTKKTVATIAAFITRVRGMERG